MVRKVIDIYVCNVICVDSEFEIDVKNFTVTSEAEDVRMMQK